MMDHSVTRSRVSLVLLWLSQNARFLSDHCLRIFMILALAAMGGSARDSAWHIVVTIFMVPAIVLVPAYGALGNSLPKRWVLVGSAAFCCLALIACGWWSSLWLAGLALVAMGSALYSPTRHAILPAAAIDTRIALARIVAVIETGAVLSMVIGMIVGGFLFTKTWTSLLGTAGSMLDTLDMRVAIAAALGLNLFCLFAVVPVVFPSDVRRPEAPLRALAGFLSDLRRVLVLPETRWTLLAISALRGIVTAGAGAFIAESLQRLPPDPDVQYPALLLIALMTLAGAGIGSLAAGLVGNLRLSLGLVPFGAAGMALSMIWAAAAPPVPWWLLLVVGAFGGLVNVPLLATYQHCLPADARGNGSAFLSTAGYLTMAVLSGLLGGLAKGGIISANGQLWSVAVVTSLVALGTCLALYRHTGELSRAAARLLGR